VGTVEVGECVGEGALLLAGRRTATVRAETPSRLIRLSREGFERAAEDEIFGALDDTVRRSVEGELSWVYLQRDEVNLPVELMQALCPGPVLVSDTSQDVDLNVDPGLEWSPSATELLLERLRPRGKRTRVPGAATVLLRALECHQAGHRRRQRAGAAFVFDLPVGRYGLIDFPSIDPIVEAGYRYATAAIDALPPEVPRTRSGR
jgi:hypothetical protein